MPPRISRSSVPNATSKSAKPFTKNNKGRKRNLNAYSIASHSTQPRKSALAKHRLGEVIDDAPTSSKRRRGEDDDDEDGITDEEEEGQNPRKMRKKGPGEDDGGVEYGSDSEGNEWTMGGLAEGDEDSELDSDEAFGESDEERFEGFTFRGSTANKRGKKKAKKVVKVVEEEEEDVDLDEGGESEEEEEDEFGEEGVDLATMLDDEDEEMLGGKDTTSRDMGEESASDEEDDDDEEEDESEEDSEDEMEDEGDDEERVARLRDRLENLDEKPSTTTPMDLDTALSVDDLLADLDPAAKAQYAAALKTKKKSAKPTTLTAPLPKRQQDKLDRQVASKKAKEQLDRWRDTVMHNRRAEHLTFPLQDPNQTKPLGKDKFVQDGKPHNELEANIQRIMEESGMVAKPGQEGDDDPETALIKSEELATNKLPIEEVMHRRAELRRSRELLFREEIKAKRIAKIKSKSYRRVHRKEKERQEQKERELLDPEGLGLHLDEDERDTIDRKRAEERMSTKHRDSKWAKSMKATNRTVWDEGARDSVHEQARRNEELKRRIAGQEVGDDESDVPSDDDDFDDDDDQHTLRQLGRLENEDESKEKGIAGMKFMKAADARRKAENDQDVKRMRKELGIKDGDESESGGEIDDQGLGRAVFGPKGKETGAKRPKQKRGELEEGDESGDDEQGEVTIQTEAKTPSKSDKKQAKKTSGPLANGQASKTKDEAEQDQGLSWLAGPGPKKSKKDRQRERANDVDTLIVTQPEQAKKDTTKSKPAKAPQATSSAPSTNGWTTIPYKPSDQDASDNDSSPSEPSNPVLTPSEQKQSYHARAFATDDIQTQTDFLAEKSALTTAEDDQHTSTHLPGWGSWAGSGLTKSIRRANARQKHNPLFKTRTAIGVAASNRKDKGLENVIISEKRDKKGGKYLADSLPHGFEKGEQYERSLRIPVGPEWSTKEVFQRGTRPRVVVRQGVVEAMERPTI